jgi:hypothetical protein
MSQYRVGFVSVTNGSNVVTGDVQLFTLNVVAGALFSVVGTGVSYQIASVVDDTTLTLSAPYGGATATGVPYIISKSFTPNNQIPYWERGDLETATIGAAMAARIDQIAQINTTITSPANGQVLGYNGTSWVNTTIAGTANEINVTASGGSITLSTPQAIATTSSPTFMGLTLTNDNTLNYQSCLNAAAHGVDCTGVTVSTSALQALQNDVDNPSSKHFGWGIFLPGPVKTGKITWQYPPKYYGISKRISGLTSDGTIPTNDFLIPFSGNQNNLLKTYTPTAVTGNGTTVTVSFATQASAPAVGSVAVIKGMIASGATAPHQYSSKFTITASTTSSVTFNCTFTDAVTTFGTITIVPTSYVQHGVILKDLFFDLSAQASTSNTGVFKSQTYGSNRDGIIEDCEFRNMSGNAVDISDWYGWKILHNKFERNGRFVTTFGIGGAILARSSTWNDLGLEAATPNLIMGNHFGNCLYDVNVYDENSDTGSPYTGAHANFNYTSFILNTSEGGNFGFNVGANSKGVTFVSPYFESMGNGTDAYGNAGVGTSSATCIVGKHAIIQGGYFGNGGTTVNLTGNWTKDSDNLNFSLGNGSTTVFNVNKSTGVVSGSGTGTNWSVGDTSGLLTITNAGTNAGVALNNTTSGKTYYVTANSGGSLVFYDSIAGVTRLAITSGGSLAANGILSLTGNTSSSSSTTGQLVVTGGAGISGALNVGGNITSSASIIATGTTTPQVELVANNGQKYYFAYNTNATQGGLYDATAAQWRLQIADTTGVLTIPTNIASTNTTTGALVVTGGIGVTGAVNAGTLSDAGNRVLTGITAGTGVSLSGSAPNLTVSIAQSVATTATPTFAQLTISNTPANASDAATKGYVDTVAQGLEIKSAVKAMVNTNKTISNPGGSTFDGITLSAGDRLLLTGQATTSQNGIWIFNGPSSALTRPTDFNGSVDGTPTTNWAGTCVFVSQGTSFANTFWVLTSDNPITIDTTSQAWSQFGGPGTYTAGTGLSLSGTTFSNVGVTSLTGTANQISVSASTGAVTLSLPQNINSGASPVFDGTNFTNIPDGALTYSSVTITAGTGLSGGGSVSLGSAITLNNAGVTSATGSNGVTASVSTGAVTFGLQNIIWFGDGSDGALTASSGTTTLTKDTYYSSVTLSGTASIQTNGWRLFVSGTLDISASGWTGSISNPGNSGGAGGNSGTSGSAAGQAASRTTFSTDVPTAGGGGVTGVGASGSTNVATNLYFGGVGGNGGAGGSGASGAGGASVSATTPGLGVTSTVRFPTFAFGNSSQPGKGGTNGCSGSSGAGDGTNNGGGGGGAGGQGPGLVIYANIINRGSSGSASVIRSKGGNGGAGGSPTAGNTGGGGGAGGGGGGLIYIVCNQITGTTQSNVFDVSGGNGGNGGSLHGTGTNGTGGNGGNGGVVTIINLGAGTVTISDGRATTGTAGSGTTGGAGATYQVSL